jgi:ABC-type branched-subunit amino acid transport system substrate-binding protein
MLLWTVFPATLVIGSCRQPAAAGTQSPLAAEQVDPEFRRDWERVLAAQAADPAADAVVEAADDLLAREPPAELRVGALHAKAQQAYLAGDDARALAWLDEAGKIVESSDEVIPDPLELEVVRLRVFTLVRGGDPAQAVAVLDEVAPLGVLDEGELVGARAVAFDRNGDHEQATLGYAQWRALTDDARPEAAYAEQRLLVLASALGPERLLALADQATVPDARACLQARAGVRIQPGHPSWVDACRELPRKVGILLPRTGRLAALADTQLAAATAAVRVLAAERSAEVLWRDAGSSPQTARVGAQALLQDGAQVIVGPVGAANVAAAGQAARAVPVVTPGEPAGPVAGVAPSLEARAQALVEHVRGTGAEHLVVFAPSNPYGDRMVKALQASLKNKPFKSLKIQRYETTTTSFAATISPVSQSLTRPRAAAVVADSLGRTELLLRQLRRGGLTVDPSGRKGSVVAATGEGVSPAALGKGHEALEGVVLAPVASADPAAAAFVEEYTRLEGKSPDPQALLVWMALRRAWSGETGAAPDAPGLVRIEGGRLVSLAASG